MDFVSLYISVGWNPSGALSNLSIEAIPHISAPEAIARFLISLFAILSSLIIYNQKIK
jgi:hypothetical protein